MKVENFKAKIIEIQLNPQDLLNDLVYSIQARFALACAARLADTLCPPEVPFGRLESHWLIIREITSLNMSVLLC